MQKFAACVQYNGNKYCGWQIQKKSASIQIEIENALTKFSGSKITTYCSGRTDAKVHAICQIIHFSTHIIRSNRQWMLGVNTYLPYDIAVIWIIPVKKNFHARYSATSRRYVYVIYNHIVRPGIFQEYCATVFFSLNVKKMQKSANKLIGKHDFTSFRSKNCQSKTAYRIIHNIKIFKYGKYIYIDICANSFVHHMVRNIVGTLIQIGKGEKSEFWISELLILKDRKLAGPTASPNGLYLAEVCYPKFFKIPHINMKISFFNQFLFKKFIN
ncbi:tRNA pseudouridine synthase A [Wigglesworthia glossinidia endosymbiont of Glossina morsitans morsitans (Yale colony)]|uniref:tRNA pseudouridine synthase A n=1 Tax=Wigglesworthia glossinidia endosymbiont of Glossina morsitans morsitans (Yale colony) TaxID=1142511 RepID=H6Q508_WIGGL|nr:tRNA pseudouridine(38-40) synthase TruA [Wigglesworthia glossinidia]AFA41291.1 tRNA pseudouridine synthase A [Wigglesworthia glossinidia endosymbiont of Glossina morsitans morsitans (Yale colony)]